MTQEEILGGATARAFEALARREGQRKINEATEAEAREKMKKIRFLELSNSQGHKFYVVNKKLYRLRGIMSGNLYLDPVKPGQGIEDTRYTNIYEKVASN